MRSSIRSLLLIRTGLVVLCVAQFLIPGLARQGSGERVVPVIPRPPAPASAPVAPVETVAIGKHYKLIFHFAASDAAKVALEVAESSWPRIARVLDADGETPPKPLPIHVYATVAEYEAVEAARTRGYFKKSLSFSDWETQMAHIVLQPPLVAARLRELGLPRLTRTLIAHEAAHLAFYSLTANYRYQPEWFSEGLAEWSASEAVAHDALARDPIQSTEILIVQNLIARGSLPSFAKLMSGEFGTLSSAERYAVEGLWFRYLTGPGLEPRLIDVGRELRRLGGGSLLWSNVHAFADSVFPLEKRDELETGFRTFIGDFKPEWNEVYRSLEPIEGGYEQFAFEDQNAIAWRQGALDRSGFQASGKLRICSGASGSQLNFLFERGPEHFFQIAFRGDRGTIELLRRSMEEPEWTTLGGAHSDKLSCDRALEFAIELSPGKLELRVAGEVVLSTKLDDPLTGGEWGLGALAGSAGTWTDLKVESRSSAK